MLSNFRPIWHPKMQGDLISENTLADHLKRISKLLLGLGWCSLAVKRH